MNIVKNTLLHTAFSVILHVCYLKNRIFFVSFYSVTTTIPPPVHLQNDESTETKVQNPTTIATHFYTNSDGRLDDLDSLTTNNNEKSKRDVSNEKNDAMRRSKRLDGFHMQDVWDD